MTWVYVGDAMVEHPDYRMGIGRILRDDDATDIIRVQRERDGVVMHVHERYVTKACELLS